jgi:hypothetical protein
VSTVKATAPDRISWSKALEGSLAKAVLWHSSSLAIFVDHHLVNIPGFQLGRDALDRRAAVLMS